MDKRTNKIARESFDSSHGINTLCQCCLSSSELQQMLREYKRERDTDNYCSMLEYSFSIQVNTLNTQLWICIDCIRKLRAVCQFRKQIEESQAIIWENIKLIMKDEDPIELAVVTSRCDLKVENDVNSGSENADVLLGLDDRSDGITTPNHNDDGIDDKYDLFLNDEDMCCDVLKTKKKRKSGKRLKNELSFKTIKKSKKGKTLSEIKCQIKKELNEKPSLRKDILPFKVMKKLNNRKCQLCGKEFVCFKDLQNHMHEHYPMHVCHVCGKFYATETTLKSHTDRVHGPPKYNCPECGKQYRNRYSIKTHVSTVHRGEKLVTSHRCAECDESFSTYYRRVVHMIEKHGFEPYKCQECGKGFINCGTLRTHVRRDHRMERKFQCELCSKSFFSNKDLLKHMICHNGEKIFECVVCLKSYARKKTLIEHLKSHNPVKAHICSDCGRGFTQKCTLNAHMKTHEKEHVSLSRS